jgi:hypothetical protein
MTKKWEYLMHYSYNFNDFNVIDKINEIITDGFLRFPSPESRIDFKSFQKNLSNSSDKEQKIPPYIYTQYIYSEIPLTPSQYWSYGQINSSFNRSSVVFIIDIKAIRDLPFYACQHVLYGSCLYYKDNVILHGSGNLKTKPNLSKLRKFIELQIKYLIDNPIKGNKNREYQYSHEILFESIPVSYIKAIAGHFTSEQKKNYMELFKKHKLDIKLVPLSPNFHKVFDNL